MKKCETKSFMSFKIAIKESIISKFFKILNHKGNMGKKNFRTEIITTFFVSFWNQLIVFFLTKSFVCFCSLLKNGFTRVVAASVSPHSLWRSQVKLVLYPRFCNTLSETLQIYTFFIIGLYCWWNKINNAKGLENEIMQCNIWCTSTR